MYASLEEQEKKALSNLKTGLIVTAVGIAITVGTLLFAQSRGGGSYWVAYGAVIYGLLQAFKGLADFLYVERQLGEKSVFWASIGLAVVVVGIVVGLTVLVLKKPSNGTPSLYMDTPQTISSDEFGVSINLPEGFSEAQVEQVAESDTSLANIWVYAYNEDFAYSFTSIEYFFAGLDDISFDEMVEFYGNNYDELYLENPVTVTVGSRIYSRVFDTTKTEYDGIDYLGRKGDNVIYHQFVFKKDANSTADDLSQKAKTAEKFLATAYTIY